MLTIISCRKNGTNPNAFGEHRLEETIGSLSSTATGDQPILVHGYNAPSDQLAIDYATFVAGLGVDCTLYSWPGGCHPLDFLCAVERANIAGPLAFRDFLEIRRLDGLNPLGQTIITHSLGARLALGALQVGSLQIENLILMAAAVDWNCLDATQEFGNVAAQCKAVHVLYSNRDEVLKMAFPCGDIGGCGMALGCDGPRDPLVLPRNVFLHDLSASVGSHHDYLINPLAIALVNTICSEAGNP